MQCWPSLTAFGKYLPMPGGNLFYYDSAGNATPTEHTGPEKNDTGGKPVVVLIHGLGDEADTWRHVFPALADAGYRVLAVDLPGFGRSNWNGGISIGVHCKAVLRLITSVGAFAGVGVERSVVLVGSSLGAGIAELIAVNHPGLVKGIVLVAGCFPFENSVSKKLLLLGLPFLGKKWYRGFRKNHEAARKSLYSYYGNLDAMCDADKDFLRERVISRVESANQERGYLSTVRSMNVFLMFSSRFIARKIKLFPGRILVLCGEKDRVFPPEKTALLRSLRPDAEFVTATGAGHLPHQEKPELSTVEILRFLSTVNSTGK